MAEDSAPDSRIDHASSIEYWEGIDADVNGMLGGFPHVSRVCLSILLVFAANLISHLSFLVHHAVSAWLGLSFWSPIYV